MASKLCDSCKSATATLFCRADTAFLCLGCDAKIHAANKLASRHARVWICEVCEQAPAHVTCKADAAALCVTCDRDIHSANPLARRHERLPVTPFYDPVHSVGVPSAGAVNFFNERCCFSDGDDVSREEAEAASWLLPNPQNPNNNKSVESSSPSPDLNSGDACCEYVFTEIEPCLDLDFGSPVDPKVEDAHEQNSSGTDGVVPVQNKSSQIPSLNEHFYDMEMTHPKNFNYGYNGSSSQCLSQSVSSSSMEVGVVPDANAYGKTMIGGENLNQTVQISGADREARVLRYREKRKNRKFEKTIRYASRKAYAETRPRIKGRFAKRSEADRFGGYGVVPSC